MCSEGVEAKVDILISTVYLLDVAYDARALCRHCGKQQGDAGADIRGQHVSCLELEIVVMPDDYCPVGIAQDYLRPHVYQPVHEEKPALEHLLVDQHAAFALRGNDKHHAEEVWGESWPWGIRDCHYRAVKEGVYDIAFLFGDIYVVSSLLKLYPEPSERFRDYPEIVV